MKKFTLFLIVIAVMIGSPFSAFASEASVQPTVDESNAVYTYFEDGSYLVTVLTVESIEYAGTRATGDIYTVKAAKDVTYRDSGDNLDWIVTLTGTFYIHEGYPDSGMAETASITSKIYDDSWSMHDKATQCTTNNATGECKMKSKFLFVTTQTVNIDIFITCDRYGNVS